MADTKIRNMEEFAAKCGISRPTVSKYFHDPSSVRGSTRRKIEEALERFDYRPNVYAINQNRRLTKNIGIVVPYVADPFFAEVARNIEMRCLEAGYSPTTFSSHGMSEHENDILETLRSIRPAGVLLAPLGRTSDRAHIEAFTKEVPTVLVDSNLEGLGAAFIGSDNNQSISQIVDYLCRTGEPPCFFEVKLPVNPNANKRRIAYIATMEKLGNDPKVLQVDGSGWDFEAIGYRAAMQLLSDKKLPSQTILCSNDRLAIGVLAAAYESGHKVGLTKDCDLRVAGHDDHPFARFTCPPLTTAAQDYDAIASRSVETLFTLIQNEGKHDSRAETLFENRLVMRASA